MILAFLPPDSGKVICFSVLKYVKELLKGGELAQKLGRLGALAKILEFLHIGLVNIYNQGDKLPSFSFRRHQK